MSVSPQCIRPRGGKGHESGLQQVWNSTEKHLDFLYLSFDDFILESRTSIFSFFSFCCMFNPMFRARL